VIGGRIDVVGGARGRILEAIELLKAHAPSGPALTVAGDRLVLGEGDRVDAAVWLIAFDEQHDVVIERGENRGRTLRYHQVVRELSQLGHWQGRAIEFALPLVALGAAGRDGAAVLVQRLSDGAILAATRLALTPP
jgi:hypothetical protein